MLPPVYFPSGHSAIKYSINEFSIMTIRLETYRSLLAILILACLIVVGPATAEEDSLPKARPTYLGLAPAYPTGARDFGRREPILSIQYDSLVWMSVLISQDGSCSATAPDSTTDAIVVRHLSQFLDSMRFVPAEMYGEPIASRLCIHVRFRPNGLAPIVTWPIGDDGVVADQSLYTLTLRANGVEPPKIRSFPSYHGSVKKKDSVSIYPFVLTRLDLDSSGVPTAITPMQSTYVGFDALVRTACNWATYSPATVKGNAVPSTIFVLVSFFPNVSYPTKRLDFTSMTAQPLREAMRVRALCDTLGPLAPALPGFVADDSLLMEGKPGISTGEGTILCLVDTLGRARAGRIAVSSYLQPRMQRLVSQLRFFPAIAHTGHPAPFSGPVRIRFTGSEYVRIDLLWLPPDNPFLNQ